MPPPAKPVYSNRGGIVTTTQVECWKQRLKTEEEISKLQLVKEYEKIGDLSRPNDFLYYYRSEDAHQVKALEFTYDKVLEGRKFDPKAPNDTFYPAHERARHGFKSSRPVKTSQAYGWLAPIDMPKYGFERTRICQDSFMDNSHL